MKRKSLMKAACIFAVTTVFTAALAGCGDNTEKDDEPVTADSSSVLAGESSETAEESSLQTEESEPEESIEAETSSTEEAVTEAPVATPSNAIADLSFLYGSPNAVEISARIYDVVEYEPENENAIGYFEAEVDIIDTGTSYLLGIDTIRYYLGVADYRSFIDSATEPDGTTEDDGKMTYHFRTVVGNDILRCMGENFRLVSYYVNDAGRGFCEFLGEDGETYYINNDISPFIDDFTDMPYLKLVNADGQDVFRELNFAEGTYIEIPYDAAQSTGMPYYAAGSPDVNSGNPGGFYRIQFDIDGNIVTIQGW